MLELSDKEFKICIINLLKNLSERGQHAWEGGKFQQRNENGNNWNEI